jgi:hypothetical protein
MKEYEDAHTWLDEQKVPRLSIILGKENTLSLVGRIRALLDREHKKSRKKYIQELETIQSEILVRVSTARQNILADIQDRIKEIRL